MQVIADAYVSLNDDAVARGGSINDAFDYFDVFGIEHRALVHSHTGPHRDVKRTGGIERTRGFAPMRRCMVLAAVLAGSFALWKAPERQRELLLTCFCGWPHVLPSYRRGNVISSKKNVIQPDQSEISLELFKSAVAADIIAS